MKKKSIFLIILVSIAFMMMSIFSVKVNAATVNITGGLTEGKAVSPITRTVTGVTNPVTNTFTYTIEQVKDQDKYAKDGCTGAPTSATVEFNATAPVDGTATATGNIDFSSTTFSKAGDYLFKVTETGSTDTTNYPLDKSTYYVVVHVTNKVDSNGNATEDLVATLVAQGRKDNIDAETKSEVKFTSDIQSKDLTINKKVTGASADATKYFKLNVNIKGNDGDTYTVKNKGTNADNPDTINANTDTTIYVKGGEKINISGIPVDTEFTVIEENQANSDDSTYTTYITKGVNGTEDTTPSKIVTGKISATADDNTYTFRNDKQDTNITGIFFNIIPYLVLVALAIIGIGIIRKNTKK